MFLNIRSEIIQNFPSTDIVHAPPAISPGRKQLANEGQTSPFYFSIYKLPSFSTTTKSNADCAPSHSCVWLSARFKHVIDLYYDVFKLVVIRVYIGALSCRPQDLVLKVSRQTLANMPVWLSLSASTKLDRPSNKVNLKTFAKQTFAKQTTS